MIYFYIGVLVVLGCVADFFLIESLIENHIVNVNVCLPSRPSVLLQSSTHSGVEEQAKHGEAAGRAWSEC